MATIEKQQDQDTDASSVLASLEPDQLSQAKRRHVPRRILRPSQVLLLWSLRLYLLFMLAVVIYQVWTGA